MAIGYREKFVLEKKILMTPKGRFLLQVIQK